MSVIVNTEMGDVTVESGAGWNVDQFSLNVTNAEGEQVASFRDWLSVTILS